jgi:hypothetical protein
VFHVRFGHQHTLGSTETPERRVRLDVGLATVALDPDVVNLVRVLGVEESSVHDREGEVGCVPGIVKLLIILPSFELQLNVALCKMLFMNYKSI